MNLAAVATPASVTRAAWALWALSWIAAAFWRSRAASRPSLGAETAYRVVTIAGVLLLFDILPVGALDRDLWFANEAALWTCCALVIAGFLFTWWARLHLGVLWSGSVTRKDNHRIVDTGPYGLVRHPIYTGLILAVAATAAMRASASALAGAGLIILGFWMKARLEESFLSRELGEAAYADYKKRVPMLVPFARFGGRGR